MGSVHRQGAKIPIKMPQESSFSTQQVCDSEWAL